MAQIPAEITDMRVVGALAPQSGDTQPPTIPQNLLATAINAGRIDLSWTASTDDIGVSGYQIFRGATPLNTTPGTTYSDTTCQPSTLYSYTVVAFDVAGNSSAASTAATATTPANAAPSWSSVPAQTLIVGNSYSLSLTTYCTDADLDTLTFTVTAGTLPTGLTLASSTISGTPTTAGQTPTITVQAADQFHQISTTIAFHSYTADVTAPPIPTGLLASAASSSQLNLSWSASTDAAGSGNEFVSGTQDYRLYRSTDGANFSLRATITAPTVSYSDTGLAASTQYFYKIAARDVQLNESAQSPAANATTQAVASGFDFYIGPSGSDSNAGTLASPWAITALNTKQATYSPALGGSRIGLLPGVYDVSGFVPKTGGYDPLLLLKGGIAGRPLIIEAVTIGTVEIRANNGASYPHIDGPIMGDNPSSRRGYIEIRGIKFTGGGSKTISLGDNGSSNPDYAGYVFENNEVTGMDCRGVAGGGNYSCIEIHSSDAPILRNNNLHDNIGHTLHSSDHWANIQMWAGRNALIELNTLKDGGVYGKASKRTGDLIRWNYIDCSTLTAAPASGIQDFSGTDTDTTGTSIFEQNVLVASQNDMRETTGASYFHHPVKFRFNTIHTRNNSLSAGGLLIRAGAGLLDCYGNIFYDESTGDHAFAWVNASADGVMNYNQYFSAVGDKKWNIFAAPNDNNRSGQTTLAGFISAMGGGNDANSAETDPLFTNSGVDALKYLLSNSSPCKNTARSDGTVGGTLCDKGAWGGATPPTRIGYLAP